MKKKTLTKITTAMIALTLMSGTVGVSAAANNYSGYYLLPEKQNYTTPAHEKTTDKAYAQNKCTSIVNATAANWWISPNASGSTLYTGKKKITAGVTQLGYYTNKANAVKGAKVRMTVENATNSLKSGTISGAINFY